MCGKCKKCDFVGEKDHPGVRIWNHWDRFHLQQLANFPAVPRVSNNIEHLKGKKNGEATVSVPGSFAKAKSNLVIMYC